MPATIPTSPCSCARRARAACASRCWSAPARATASSTSCARRSATTSTISATSIRCPRSCSIPRSSRPGIGELTKIMVERYKAKTNATDVPPHCSMGFNQTWILLNNVLPVAKEKYGGFDPEAVRKAALDVDIAPGGTIQGYGVKFFPPGTPALRPERTLDAGRHAECRRAHLGGLSDQHPDAGSGAAAAEIVGLRNVAACNRRCWQSRGSPSASEDSWRSIRCPSKCARARSSA